MLSNVADTTLYSKCDRASDLWEQLELASELESDLRDRSNNNGSIDVKIDVSVLEEKSKIKKNHLNQDAGVDLLF